MNTQLVAPIVASLLLAIAGCSSDDGDSDSTAGAGGTAAGAGGAAAGAGGAAAGAGGSAGTAAVFCDAPNTVFMLDGTLGGCNGASCHIPANVDFFPPDLISADVATRLLNASASVTCTTMSGTEEKYIDTANIDNSLILKKLTAATASCGSVMPLGAPTTSPLLTADQVACIRNWALSVSGH